MATFFIHLPTVPVFKAIQLHEQQCTNTTIVISPIRASNLTALRHNVHSPLKRAEDFIKKLLSLKSKISTSSLTKLFKDVEDLKKAFLKYEQSVETFGTYEVMYLYTCNVWCLKIFVIISEFFVAVILQSRYISYIQHILNFEVFFLHSIISEDGHKLFSCRLF